MERHPHHPDDNERNPAVNSYGTDDPETQAHIENARVDAARERQRNRSALERLVELGLSPDDAEAVIEADQAIRQARPDDEHGESTIVETNRHDLTELLALKGQPRGAAALAALAADLRRGTPGMGVIPAPPEAVSSYQAIGLDRRDALTIAGFEYFLRYRLAIADDTAATTSLATGEQPPQLQPRVYISAGPNDDPDASHGRWIDATQSVETIEEDIAELLRLFPDPAAMRWAVTEARDLGDVDLAGISDTHTIATLGQGVAEHGAAFLAWARLHGTDDRELLARFNDFYVGSFLNESDWVQSMVIDLQWLELLDRVVDPAIRQYLKIDLAKIARAARATWDVVDGPDGRVYVFLR